MEVRTLKLMENVLQGYLEDLQTGELDKEGEERGLKIIELMSKQMDVHERTASEIYDKEERRRIDEERNKATAKTEAEKIQLTWKKVLFELAKVVIPTGLSIGAYHVFQKRLLQFEETGRLTSSASKGLNLPKFWR